MDASTHNEGDKLVMPTPTIPIWTKPTKTPTFPIWGKPLVPDTIPAATEDIPFTLTKGGEDIELTYKPSDSTVWQDDKLVGSIDKATGDFIPKEPSVGRKILGGVFKAIDYTFYPFTAFGMLSWSWGKDIEGQLQELGERAEQGDYKALILQDILGVRGKDTPTEPQMVGLDKEAVKEWLPGGGVYEKYRSLPWYQQLLYEAPAWALLGKAGGAIAGSRALSAAVARGGAMGRFAQVGRVALAPIAAYETGVGKITSPIVNKILSVAQQRAVKIALRQEATRLGIKLTTQTEKQLIVSYKAALEQHLNRELVAWMARNPTVKLTEKTQSQVINYLLRHASPDSSARMMISALEGGVTPQMIASGADQTAMAVAKMVPVALKQFAVTPTMPTVTGLIPPTTTGIMPTVTGITEGITMPAGVQQEILSQAEILLQQVPEVLPNNLHVVGIPEGEAFIRTDSAGNPLVAGTSHIREGQLTLSTVVSAQPGTLTSGRALVDVGNYIKENNIAFPPREEMSPEAIRVYDKLAERGEIPEYAPTTAMAEWETVTGKAIIPKGVTGQELVDMNAIYGKAWDAAWATQRKVALAKRVGLSANVGYKAWGELSPAQQQAIFAGAMQEVNLPTAWDDVMTIRQKTDLALQAGFEKLNQVFPPKVVSKKWSELSKADQMKLSSAYEVSTKGITTAMAEGETVSGIPEVPPSIEGDSIFIPEKLPSVPPPISPEANILGRSENEWGGFMADLQDAQTVADIAFRNDVVRKWANNLPGMRGLFKLLNPQVVANTPAEKAAIIRATLKDEGYQKTQGVIAYLQEVGNQEKIFGELDSKGFIKEGKLKGNTVGDIAGARAKWEVKLTDEQRLWLDRAKTIEKATVEFLKLNDIDIKLLSLEEGGQFATRRVWGKTLDDGSVIDTAFVGAGVGRPGSRLPTEKHRIFKTEAEAIEADYHYIPYEEALYLKVIGAYNRVADKKMADWLLSQVPWRTTGASEELILAAEAAKHKLRHSQMLLAALNRAVRGERVPDVTLRAIATSYPDQAQELKDLIPRLQAAKPSAKEIKNLTNVAKGLIDTNKMESYRAVAARARAREAAMRVKIGEAVIPAPAFQGKILTGPEARETARTLRKTFEPSFNKALGQVNKANAVARYFMLAGDYSPFTIQLLFLIGENPQIYGRAFGGAVRAMLDPKFHSTLLSEHKATIDRHPNLSIAKGGTTEFTEAMARGGWLSGKTSFHPDAEVYWKSLALFLPRAVGKVGGLVLTPFQRVFEYSLDAAGIYLAEAYEHLCTTPARTADVDQFINEFRGLTSSARIGVSGMQRQCETALILAPRYNRAIAGLVFDLSRGNIRGHLARKSLIKGIAALCAIAVAISIARGEDKDEILEHFNPNSSMFFTWDIAGQKVGPGSKIRSLIKLIAQSSANPDKLLEFSMDNPALRFVRGNLSPVTSSAIDLITGRSYIGDPTRDGMLSFSKEILGGNLLPIWVQSTLLEGGSVIGRTWRGLAEFFGGRAYPEPLWDEVRRLRDRYAKQDFNMKYEDLNRAQIDKLKDNHPDLNDLEEKARLEQAERGDEVEYGIYLTIQEAVAERNDTLENAAALLLNGSMSKYDYDKERGYARPYYSGGMSAIYSLRDRLDPGRIKDIQEWLSENQKPEDKALDAYQEYRASLIEKSELPRDWDEIEVKCEAHLAKLPPKIREYVKANLNRWINDLPENAKKIELMRLQGIEDETWWDDYRDYVEIPATGEIPTIPTWGGETQEPTSPTETPDGTPTIPVWGK